jgi:hypothetical protein
MLLVLPCTEVLVVGVTSFRERERIPSLFGGSGCVCVVVLARGVRYLSDSSLEVALASPFIVSKGRARDTFVLNR